MLIMMGLIAQDVFVEGRNTMAAFIQKAPQFILGYVSLYLSNGTNLTSRFGDSVLDDACFFMKMI